MVQTNNLTPLIICGPTASGKSDIAIEAANSLNGEIISADSMQIYKGLNIGTAKIDRTKTDIPHYMIDIVDPSEEFSVAEYKKQSQIKLSEIILRGKVPIISGGTGLYINALIYDYDFAESPKNDELRNYYKGILEEKGKAELYNMLKKIDPLRAGKISENDTKRVIRALEIIGTNKNNEPIQNKPKLKYYAIGLNIDRIDLYSRINLRVEHMFKKGLTEEVKAVLTKINFDAQSMQAIGYKEFKDFFDNKITKAELIGLIQKNTRNYAKRQITWFKKLPGIIWSTPQNALQTIKNLYGIKK